MLTTEQVWQYMLDYQERTGMPPKLDEIEAAIPELNYRSSVRYTVQALVEAGRVVATDDPGTARRYRAVGQMRQDALDDLPASQPVIVVSAEALR